MDYYILKWEFYFLRMEIIHYEIGNSTDILESKTNLPLYSQINYRKCRIYWFFSEYLSLRLDPVLNSNVLGVITKEA